MSTTMNLTGCGRSALKVKQRDIVLVPFPFSDTTTTKVRPALVVSHDTYNASYLDAVVLAMTSNTLANPYKVVIASEELEQGSLPETSAVRVDKPYSVLQSKVLKVQGKVSEETLEQVLTTWIAVFREIQE